MKDIPLFAAGKPGILLTAVLFLIPGLSMAQTNAAALDSVLPWQGVWTVVDEADSTTPPGPPGEDRPRAKAVLEIRSDAGNQGLDIVRTDTEQPLQELIIPDGVARSSDSGNCSTIKTYRWVTGTGLLLGTSNITCKDSASYEISTLKMMASSDRMVDILFFKTAGEPRLAVRRFAFERELPSAPAGSASLFDHSALAMRIAVSEPWDMGTVIRLARTLETPVLEAALLERNLRIKLDSKSLKKMKSAKVPDSVIDLLVALSAPDKFTIEKNGRIAVDAHSPARNASGQGTPGHTVVFVDSYAGHPFRYWSWGYWNYGSPFWWGYPIYVNSGGSGGNGGGGNHGGASGQSAGRLSATKGYVQVTPRDTGHHAVPRRSVASGSTGGYSAPASGGSASYSGGTAGSSTSSGGASSGAPTASPSGYSSGGRGGTAVSR